MSNSPSSSTQLPDRLWRALQVDPLHASEVGLLYLIRSVTASSQQWYVDDCHRHPEDSCDARARRAARHATRMSRFGGALTGGSFMLGIAAAMLMIYLEQIQLILRIAAINGFDVTASERLAEILVIQGDYPSLAEAAGALTSAGRPPAIKAKRHWTWSKSLDVLIQVPTMIGVRFRDLASRWERFVLVATYASSLFPPIGIPVWSRINVRTTRRIGASAVNFYANESATSYPVAMPPASSSRRRRVLEVVNISLAAVLALMAVWVHPSRAPASLGWILFALGETSLVLVVARLVWLMRRPRSSV